MGVVTPERPAEPPPAAPAPEPPPRRFPTGLVVLAVVILGGFLFVGWVRDLIPDFGNPFTTETVDRSGPAVLKSIQNLQDFQAASGHFEVIVDVEQDTRFVPSSIEGQRMLFVAIGSVDAGVSFSGLDETPSRSPTIAAESRSSCRRRPSTSRTSTRRAVTSTTATAVRSTGSSLLGDNPGAAPSSTRWPRRSSRTRPKTAPDCSPGGAKHTPDAGGCSGPRLHARRREFAEALSQDGRTGRPRPSRRSRTRRRRAAP